MKFVLLVSACLLASALAESELEMEEGGKYSFLYSVEDAGAHQRQESSDGGGTVSGSYSYVDANGDLRRVEYKAGADIGFQPTGDIGVDKKTAEKAKEVAALAPKAPVVEAPEVKIPASPFTFPLLAMPGIHPHVPTPILAHPLALPYAYLHHRPLFVL